MATKGKRFFETPQAAAVLKHGLQRRYLPVFASKTGSVAGEVVYIDGYAGPGLYKDGSAGSPTLALETANVLEGNMGNATLHGHLIERDRGFADELGALLSARGSAWEVHHGRVESKLPDILASLDPTTPLFAFIDPFGLPIPMSMVKGILARGGHATSWGQSGAPTELLLNFSIPGFNRQCGRLTENPKHPSAVKARATTIARLDRVLGGSWWQAIWWSAAPDRIDQIRNGYKDQLLRTGGPGWSIFDIAVADAWQGPSSYHLLMMTRHVDGVWAFTDCMSTAREEYRQHCFARDGILEFEPEEVREQQWVDEIAENIEKILTDGRPFQPVRRLADVYGTSFGHARNKHVRGALNRLLAEGKTSTNPKGKSSLAKIWVAPP